MFLNCTNGVFILFFFVFFALVYLKIFIEYCKMLLR